MKRAGRSLCVELQEVEQVNNVPADVLKLRRHFIHLTKLSDVFVFTDV